MYSDAIKTDTRAQSALPGRLDVVFAVIVLFLGSRYLPQYGLHSLLWLAMYVMFLGLFASRFSDVLLVMRSNLAFLAYPALCLSSVLWSQAPENSLRFSVQVTMSIMMAIYIGHRLGLRRLIYVLLLVSGVGLFLSALNISGLFFHPFDRNNLFIGVFQSKNALGEGATHYALAATGLLMFVPRLSLVSKLMLIAGLVATLALLTMAKTASGLLLTLSGGGGVLAVGLLYRGPIARAILLGCGALVLAVAIFAMAALAINPWIELLRALGKDTTLTGRTDLWEHGFQVFSEHPLLGVGVDAFWAAPQYQNFIVAFQSFHGAGVLSFHNLIVELLVAFGVLGLLTHLLIATTIGYRGLLLSLSRGTRLGVWALVACAVYYLQSMVGTTLVKPHEGNFMMLIAIGAALGKELHEQAGGPPAGRNVP